MSLDVSSLCPTLDNILCPIPDITVANSCITTNGPELTSALTRDGRQVDETQRTEQQILENLDALLFSDFPGFSPSNVPLLCENEAEFPATLPQESIRRPESAPLVLSLLPDLRKRPVALPDSARIGPVPDPSGDANAYVSVSGPSQSHRDSFPPTYDSVPQIVQRKVDGSDFPVIDTVVHQAQRLPQPAQPVRNWSLVPPMASHSPAFRVERASSPAISVSSTNATQAFTANTPGVAPPLSNPCAVQNAETGTHRALLSQANCNAASAKFHLGEGCGSEFHDLKRYDLDGFTFSKVWVHNPEVCAHCDEDFANRNSLCEHIKRTHRDTLASSQKGGNEKTKCPYCALPLMNAANLRRHIKRVHSSKAKLACDMCTSFFGSPFSLVVHKRDMHRIQPASRRRSNGVLKKRRVFFRCDKCGYYSKEKSNVTRHVRSNHIRMRNAMRG